MSDFENKLRSLELRQPLPDWQREITEQCTFTEPQSTWRQWLWPSPLAWAALALIWVGLALVNRPEGPLLAKTHPPVSADSPLFAYHSEEADSFWWPDATLSR